MASHRSTFYRFRSSRQVGRPSIKLDIQCAPVRIPAMRTTIVDLRDHGSTFRQVIVQLIAIFVMASCTTTPDRSLPTASVATAHPVTMTSPPQRTSSPTLEPSPTASPTITTQAPRPTPESSAARPYTLQQGDTLLELARRHGVPMAAIQLHNEMGASTILRAGQVLTIPNSADWEGASPFWILHEVQPGETLIAVARAYDVDVERIVGTNNLRDADHIALGQYLVLPLSGPAATRTPAAKVVVQAAATPVHTPHPSPTLTSSAPTVVVQAPAPTGTPIQDVLPPQNLASWPLEIARLINAVRAEHGLPAFSYNEILQQAAQAHADDCVARGWCGHTGSDGASIKVRIRRAGYEGSGWAECWAQTRSPDRSVDIWMDEVPPNDPHRRTLLSEWFSEIGIGIADAGWGYYIIANFGRP